MSNPKEANFRIVRYNGEYRVEVLDKPIGWWYIVASKMTWEQALLCSRWNLYQSVSRLHQLSETIWKWRLHNIDKHKH